MIDAELIARARDVALVATAERLGAILRRATATERVGPCPKCGGRDRFSVNIKRQVWNCRGCGQGGRNALDLVMHVRGFDFAGAVNFLTGHEARPAPARVKPTPPQATDNGEHRGKAFALWRRRWVVVEDDPVWRYLREVRRYDGPIPATIGFLPTRGEHPPSMIAAIGLANEPEPGALAIHDNAVRAVHLTRLKPDGRGKAGTTADKVTIGQGSVGTPIVLSPQNDLLGLAITEGIEDGLSVHAATGLGTWAAVSAGRMSALADVIPGYVECVTIFGHRDAAGERGARELAARLADRGIEPLVKFLETGP